MADIELPRTPTAGSALILTTLTSSPRQRPRTRRSIRADDPAPGTLGCPFAGRGDVSLCILHTARTRHVRKRDELGHFQNGGSACCLIFGAGVVLSLTVDESGLPREKPLKLNAALALAQRLMARRNRRNRRNRRTSLARPRRLQRPLDGTRRARNILPDAVDSIAGCQREQRTDHQEKRHETRQHIDLDTKNRITPRFPAFVS